MFVTLYLNEAATLSNGSSRFFSEWRLSHGLYDKLHQANIKLAGNVQRNHNYCSVVEIAIEQEIVLLSSCPLN